MHTASLQSAKESGVVKGKKWIKSANACDQCVALVDKLNADFPNGIPLETNFAHVGGNPEYSEVKAPPLHPNDRCSIVYVLTDEYEQLLAEHGPPRPDTFEPGPFGPENRIRKIAKPKKKDKLEPTPYEPAYTEPAGPGEEAIPPKPA